MATYILLDAANLFFRARHAVQGNADLKIGMAFHVIFNSIKKAWSDFHGDHTVICLEGRSWRKEAYSPYKKNRTVARNALSPAEQEEDALFWEAFDEIKTFVTEKTNCTVLQHPQLEADDLIAGWIQHHPDDQHIIVSTDSDFVQLIDTNVKQYNGVTGHLITHNGVFNDKKQKLAFTVERNSKLKIGKVDNNFTPQEDWISLALFLKCMTGDPGDNVFSAFPGVRLKGSKNKVGLLEAFADRNNKGWAWNNLQLQRWVDHEGVDHRVLDDYSRNKMLIDLTAQPDNIKQLITETIKNNSTPKAVTQVGIHMLKFCNKFDMKRISDNIEQYAMPFQARYV
jgi:5'-3' exonuclease